MKKQITVLTILAALLSSSGQAAITLGMVPRTGLGPSSDAFMCAPEIELNNVRNVENALRDLSLNELRQSNQFRKLLADANKLEDSQKLDAYLDYIGVENDRDLMNLIGARENEVDPKFVYHLSKNSGMSVSESKLIIETISKAVLGSRK